MIIPDGYGASVLPTGDVIATYRPDNLPASYFRSQAFRLALVLAVGIVAISLLISTLTRPSGDLRDWWLGAIPGLLLVAFFTMSLWRRNRRSRIDLTPSSVLIDSGAGRPPLVVRREQIAFAGWLTDFRRAGRGRRMLVFFDADGVALFTLVGRVWSDFAWRHLLFALGSPPLDVVEQPTNRRAFLARYPRAIGPAERKKMRRARLVLAVSWLIILTVAAVSFLS